MDVESLLIFLVTGLVAGLLATALLKVPRPRLVGTLLLGCLGAILGGWVGPKIGLPATSLLGHILLATGGTVLVIWIVKSIR